MQIPRRYTVAGKDPFAAFTFVARTSRITNPDGSVVFEMKDLLAPESWSQVAVDVLAQKYFRKAGLPQGHYYVDPATKQVTRSTSAYERPAPHACFIQSIKDDLVNEGGIMDLWVREARIFKYGSGTGTNFSALRGEGEPLSGGGKSSGLMSFLKIGDRAAGAIKSGGTTRRAAKMVVLDLDHPDIEEFVNGKVVEEQKVAALVLGSRRLNRHLNAVLKACHGPGKGAERFEPARNAGLKKALAEARKDLIPVN